MPFSEKSFRFLKQLAQNNNREWFNENKDRYEELVRGPSLEFIEAMEKPLSKLSPHFVAVPKKVGGSLMRVYRDTRFSKDKTPFKTNIGIHFRHEFGKNVHAPGYYVHIAPGDSFLGMGIWHPDTEPLKKIRTHIVEEPSGWKRARDQKRFRSEFSLAGDSLKKAPLGFDKNHPLIEDLRRKDFIAVAPLHQETILDEKLVANVVAKFKTGAAWMRFLCDALRIPF